MNPMLFEIIDSNNRALSNINSENYKDAVSLLKQSLQNAQTFLNNEPSYFDEQEESKNDDYRLLDQWTAAIDQYVSDDKENQGPFILQTPIPIPAIDEAFHDINDIIAVILFNTALAYHLRALKSQQQATLLNKAIKIYVLANEMGYGCVTFPTTVENNLKSIFQSLGIDYGSGDAFNGFKQL